MTEVFDLFAIFQDQPLTDFAMDDTIASDVLFDPALAVPFHYEPRIEDVSGGALAPQEVPQATVFPYADILMSLPSRCEDADVSRQFISETEASLQDDIRQFPQMLEDFFLHPASGDDALMSPRDFSSDSTFDEKHHLQVIGDIAEDIKYVEQQTHEDCALMSQEQFVHHYIGRPIPEDYLEWRAEQWGVYSPEAGTNFFGQTMILDHFGIPHSHHSLWGDIGDVNRALDNDESVMVGVDAREFYEDPTIPPGSGHQVAVVGKGVDPATHEIEGFYITDTNHPGTARFMNVDSFDKAWLKDMTSIPNPHTRAV